jgi:hypothetical protein
MKGIVLLFVLICANSFGQAKLLWLIEDLPTDSIYPRSIEHHTSIKPFLLKNKTISSDSVNEESNSASLQLLGLTDIGYRQTEKSQYRAMAGAALIFQDERKWFARFSYMQGVEEATDIFRSKTPLEGSLNNNLLLKTDLRGRLSFSPNKFVNLQVGYDENFIGEGQRSLLLSDYGKPYGFGLTRLNFWRLEYLIMYQFMQERNASSQKISKFGATHYLNISAAKWLQFGLFETVFFQPNDTLLNRGFEPEYLNPMIFYRPQEYALGSADNVLIGIDGSIKLKPITLYAQLMLDEFSLTEIRAKSKWWASKYGMQAGAKAVVKMRNNPLFLRGELNVVRPYSYSHLSVAQSYTNNGEVLAHPYGANFSEILFEAKYSFGNWMAEFFINYTLKGFDDTLNYGGNIFIPYLNRPENDYGHKIGQGAKNNAFRGLLRLSYEIFEESKMQVFAEFQFRENTYLIEPKAQFLIGLRTRLWNDYRNY